MPEQVGNAKLGALLRQYREGARLTQHELAALSGVQRAYISNIELGRNTVIYPDQFRKLHRALGFPAFEFLEAMGYPTDASQNGIAPVLTVLLRNLDAPDQALVADFVKSILRTKERMAHSG